MNAQNFSWINSAGGTLDDLSGKVVRGTKNFYLYGNFEGNVTITNTQSGTPIQLINQGFGTDIFLLSVDSLGSVVWAKSFGSSGYDTTMGTVHFNYADSTILLVGTKRLFPFVTLCGVSTLKMSLFCVPFTNCTSSNTSLFPSAAVVNNVL